MEDMKKKITFKYVYPEDLRDLYVNGIFGGVTPRKEVYAHFYSERHPIPKKVVHSVEKNGTLGPEEGIELGGDVVRFIQASIVMDLQTAVAFRDWLNSRIKYIETIKEGGARND
jgi:hypothetical protein